MHDDGIRYLEARIPETVTEGLRGEGYWGIPWGELWDWLIQEAIELCQAKQGPGTVAWNRTVEEFREKIEKLVEYEASEH